MTHHIVFLDRDTIAPEVILRRPAFDHTYEEFGKTEPDQVVPRAKDATIVIANKVPLPEKTLSNLPKLRMISVAATGTDAFDTKYCKAHDIVLSNVRDYAMTTVPEHTFALILALLRSLVGYREDVRNGEWQKAGQFCFFHHPIGELRGSRLGIFGEGSIGQSVADLGRAFGMKTMFAAHKGREGLGPLYTPFDEVISTSDVLTCHCPLLPETKDMIALPEFRQMKRNAILVNTARGGLVNERDLVTAIKEGLIAGAAFDVVTSEPPASDNPLLELLDRPNFILTPHVAWASLNAQQCLADQTIDNIENFAKGQPSNRVA